MKLHTCIYICVLGWLLLLACQEKTPQQEPLVQDPHSYARPEVAAVRHLSLDIDVDFEAQVISGTATLTIERAPGADSLLLDTKDLTLLGADRSDDGKTYEEVPFSLAAPDEILGTRLAVPLGPKTQYVRITYATDPEAEALQWLAPQLTAGKQHPFLLTQSQAINARTWVPIQDGPGMRFTYDATVQVPAELLALMSAENPQTLNPDGKYEFQMNQPIPAYLLALAVGDLRFQSVGGDRTGVYAEPSMLEAAVYELGEMNQMMELAENLYGPYRWDRYDVIILPPSFPFGGMENPRLTFATPTILAGDRSLTSLVAHELAHSWSGNLVTNATWNDFWLNEGFTVYFEYRIMEALNGRDYSEMLAQLSFQDLKSEVADMGADSPYTQLAVDLSGRNPDDGVSSIAYDKGYYFLRLIEETVGRPRFDAFLKAYFTENAFQTMTTAAFLQRLQTQLLNENPDWEKQIGVEEWVYGRGIPANIPVASPVKFDAVNAAITAWSQSGDVAAIPSDEWSTHEWLQFIRNLPEGITAAQLAELDQAFSLTASTNSEIQCAWYTRAIEADYAPAYPAIRDFLLRVGRRKFLTPLYRGMIRTDAGRVRARAIYAEARPNYHPIAQLSLDELLDWKAE